MKKYSEKKQYFRMIASNKVSFSHASDIKKSFNAQMSDNLNYNRQEKDFQNMFKKNLNISIRKKYLA